MTPQDIVKSLEYLQDAGFSEEQVRAIHHFGKLQSFEFLINYFSERQRLGRDTNVHFGERLAYIAEQHSRDNRQAFGPLISEALQKWPFHR